MLLALTAAVVLSKPGYLALTLMTFFVPLGRFGSRRRAAAILLVVSSVAAVAFAWTSWIALTRYAPLNMSFETNPGEQTRLFFDYPMHFVTVAIHTYVLHRHNFMRHIVGEFGWLDTLLDVRVVYGYLIFVVVLALINGARDVRISPAQRILLGLISFITMAAITVSQWLMYTPVGAAVIEGLQGRYFIPVEPLLILLLYNRTLACDLARTRVEWLLVSIPALTLILSVVTLVRRFYL